MNETLLESIKLTRFLVPFLLIFAFLLGSIPFGLIVSRMFNLKPMGRNPQRGEEAKKARDLWPGGVLTFCLDFGKGLLAVFLATPEGAQLVLNLLGVVDVGSEMVPLTATWGAGFAVVFGHCFSPFLNFRGGKGVATAFGVILFLAPTAAGCGLFGFVLTYFYRRIVSLASLAGLGTAAVSYLVLNPIGVHLWSGAALALLVLIRHEKNIDALLENREKAFQ